MKRRRCCVRTEIMFGGAGGDSKSKGKDKISVRTSGSEWCVASINSVACGQITHFLRSVQSIVTAWSKFDSSLTHP